MHCPVNWNGIGFCQGVSIVPGINRRGIRAKGRLLVGWVNSQFDSSLSSQLNDTNFYCLFNVRRMDERILIRIPQPIWSWPVRQVKALTFRDGKNSGQILSSQCYNGKGMSNIYLDLFFSNSVWTYIDLKSFTYSAPYPRVQKRNVTVEFRKFYHRYRY